MAKSKSNVVMIAGKPVDMDEINEVASVQAMLLPKNWPIAKRDGVKLFLTIQDMLAFQLKRHLASNFSHIVHTAIDQRDDIDGPGPRVPVSFSFEIDLSAPNVAALSKIKMSFSRKFSTTGKPLTHDLNQGELILENGIGEVLDTGTLNEEMTPPVKEPKKKADKKPATK